MGILARGIARSPKGGSGKGRATVRTSLASLGRRPRSTAAGGGA